MNIVGVNIFYEKRNIEGTLTGHEQLKKEHRM